MPIIKQSDKVENIPSSVMWVLEVGGDGAKRYLWLYDRCYYSPW